MFNRPAHKNHFTANVQLTSSTSDAQPTSTPAGTPKKQCLTTSDGSFIVQDFYHESVCVCVRVRVQLLKQMSHNVQPVNEYAELDEHVALWVAIRC